MFEGLLQPMHLMVVLAIVLIVFGPGNLPEVGTAIGETIRNLKKALNEVTSDPAPSQVRRAVSHDNSQQPPG